MLVKKKKIMNYINKQITILENKIKINPENQKTKSELKAYKNTLRYLKNYRTKNNGGKKWERC